MSPNSTWLDTRTTQLRGTLLGLGLTITDSQARVLLNDKLDDYARLMHVTRRTAQRHFTDEQLTIFANSLAAAISDEAPGARLIEFERTIPMPTNALGLTIAALAEALKVAHGNLEDHSLTDGLSHLSTLGMIAADARTSTRTGTVPMPRPLLLRIARFLDNTAKTVSEGANLPDGLDENARAPFVTTLQQDADGLRALANTEDGDSPKLWRIPASSETSPRREKANRRHAAVETEPNAATEGAHGDAIRSGRPRPTES
ncbi:hypothetical protein RQN9TF_33220 (plasmid) [Rhodococcus qingshengii]|uniref:hypothetical protein n=1 Tax=Rhodococcus TaxID=1827 RepID=UPI000F6177BC|nr:MULTISPECIES: hypothetical protein [Rhodococcus]AZI66084.1 hypothetical protein EHW12_34270 [Rhodococcus sp. NJ-530]BDQ24125.1 hypothetical protein RQN9TF_33220 [Rhodococcus qingshengii]